MTGLTSIAFPITELRPSSLVGIEGPTDGAERIATQGGEDSIRTYFGFRFAEGQACL